ncbi:hypothetical protein OG497_37490 [Streptomyces sp. NBC_01242]|uniref:hypothetical protein n=1 Tax=Streptomyces sp. NBC_01242 TaxID=2903795 RepID=UPI0022581C30|nr:hypothetical protein [Streptomyces sp. NBC_01242]MCX4799553.1 hypothetical protein [Streptomyces sp. NBC_01242]
MFQRQHLSEVQHFGLELLILLDGWAESDAQAEQRNEQLRMALVAAGMSPGDVFASDPESYDDFDPIEDEGRDLDYSAVDWDEEASVDDWASLQRALDSTRVKVRGSGEEAEPDGPELPDVDFDREWQ